MSELPPDQCAHCRKEESLAVTRRPKAKSEFVEAKYKGECGVCTDEIVPGDYISVVGTTGTGDDERKVWAHYGCTE